MQQLQIPEAIPDPKEKITAEHRDLAQTVRNILGPDWTHKAISNRVIEVFNGEKYFGEIEIGDANDSLPPSVAIKHFKTRNLKPKLVQ